MKDSELTEIAFFSVRCRCWFRFRWNLKNGNTQLLQTSITSNHKNQERKKRKYNRSQDWKKKAPKPCEVLHRFLAKLDGSMKLLRSERPEIIFWKSLPIIGSKMWYRLDVSWKVVVFIVQSGLKLNDFSIVNGELKRTQNVVVSGSEAGDDVQKQFVNNESNNWESDGSTYFTLR